MHRPRTSQFCSFLHWIVFDLFFYCMTVKTIYKRVTQLIKSLHHGKHIGKHIDAMTAMTEKALTHAKPPSYSSFLHTYKDSQAKSSWETHHFGLWRPDRTNIIFCRLYLLQPIAKAQQSYLKDTTDFINFTEKTKVKENTVLVSMDVTSQYTNIP